MKFVHAADLHLDSPLRGLARYEGAPTAALRGATRRAFTNLVDLCIEERAAFLLIAGDMFDGDWRDYSTGLFFAAELSRLRAAGIWAVLLRGNHDAESQITRHLRLPDNVRELAVRAPESIELPQLGVFVHGQGFATKAVTDDLAQNYPRARDSALNIGMLHTSLGGRPGHENYAPCRLESLVAKGYDYWALGHVHQREVLSETPHVVFPGNLQGRHVREIGAKGASLVMTEGGRITGIEHRALDVVRWKRVAVDLSAATSRFDVVDRVRHELELALADLDGRTLAARISLEGATAAHAALARDPQAYANEIRAAATDLGRDGVFVEKVVVGTRTTLDLAQVRAQNDAIGQLAKSLHAMKSDPEALLSLLPELADIQQRLPLALAETLPLDPAHLAALISTVEEMLIPRLLGSDSGK